MDILTKNVYGVDVVKLFDNGITIDTKLPKWVNSAKRLEELKKLKKEKGGDWSKDDQNNYYVIRQWTNNMDTGTSVPNMNTAFTVYSTPEPYEVGDKISFDEVAAATLEELTDLIKDGQLNNVLSGYGGMHSSNLNDSGTPWRITEAGPVPMYPSKTIKGIVKGFFNNIGRLVNECLNKPELDAVKFFTFVKLASKESAVTYRDRVSKYLKALHNAKMVGQTALVEKLLSEMIANKYESLLFSNGKYHVITEEQLVNFVKKTERGVDLTYIKNFTRPIPCEVIDEVAKANELEVFDNYVILHYDPKGTAKRETKKEEAKRRDPILFGVIAGSNKLYYITDWIDEYCDLTLEKFVDTIGVKKDDLLEGGPLVEETKEVKKEDKEEKKEEKKPAKKKTTSTTKKKPTTKK